MNPPEIIEALAAAMHGQTVEQYREEVKARAEAYRYINKLAHEMMEEKRRRNECA